jgi:chromosome segregation protein
MKETKFKTLADADLKKKIEDVKFKMVELGNINMNAGEEYNDILNRLNFLMDQKSDLNNSIQSLEDIIKKLDRISKEKFNSDLEKIRLKFNDLFCFLFGGGFANILNIKGEKVTEENKGIDTSGIEINVQMPGKKLSGINLLSQGEKALVAISLIFAIFIVKKTPFCVIDEVDAPLDEANNERYNKLIKEISASSQVIMVTHNKKTMEIGDYIFGVTSKEPGISKVVSVVMN